MDVPTLIRKVQRRFGDSANVVITQQDIFDWANEGQLEIARKTNSLMQQDTFVAGNLPIVFEADFVEIRRVTYDGIALTATTLEDLDAKYLLASETGIPLFYYQNTLGQYALWPDPVSTDTKSVVVTYIKKPADITTTGSTIEIPVAFHESLVSFCVMRAHERNENYQAMKIAQDQFESRLTQDRYEASNVNDSYPVIRDDPYEMWY